MLTRWTTARALRRHDARTAALARGHAVVGVLTQAVLLVDLTWAAGAGCAACARDGRGHGGAAGSTGCLVGALSTAAGPDTVGLRDTIDVVWRRLHHTGHRPIHWNAPHTRQLLQANELRVWNDHRDRSAGEVLALLRASYRTTTAVQDRMRTGAARPPVPAVAPR